MGFSRKLQYFLVHSQKFSNSEALALIAAGRISIDGEIVTQNCVLEDQQEIAIDTKVVREKANYRYLLFHKPKGYESTLNTNNKNSIASFFEAPEQLIIAGRLDKDSEGLLLLSSNGKWVEQICNPEFEKEKEYIVQLSTEPTSEDISRFESGFEFRYKQQSRPCLCQQISANTLRIIIKEGKNRQLRRMWYKLGYEVKNLLRVRVDNYMLGSLPAGKYIDFQLNN